jgi:antitoxin HicB
MKLRVLLLRETDGRFSVAVPALPGCFSEGETESEALLNAREAAEAWLEASNENASPFGDGDTTVKEIVREIDL